MTHEYSLTLMIALAAVAILTGHVSLGWMALARRNPSPTLGWKEQMLLSVVLGTGTCATSILGLTNGVVNHELGYGAVAAPVIWLGAVIVCLPLAAALANSRSAWAVALGAVLLTAAALGAHMGWVWAAGFRPGVEWNLSMVVAACGLMSVGFAFAIWAAGTIRSSQRTSGSARREPQHFLKAGAATVLGLSLIAGQQLMLWGSDIDRQLGSAYRNQVPTTLLALACGALLPLTLALMSLDLALRRRQRLEHRSSGFAPQRRRKRRHRVRTL